MIKQKLIDKRKERNLTQEDLAFRLGMETSNYNRRENGIIKISKKEWDKIAKELDTKLEEIYEPEDGVYIFNNENSSGNFFGPATNNIFNNMSELAIETMKKYIDKIELENKELLAENIKLKQIIEINKF